MFEKMENGEIIQRKSGNEERDAVEQVCREWIK